MLQPPESLGIDTERPSVARVYDALLGGKDNFDVDRAFVRDRLVPASPHVRQLARDNRAFLGRAIRYLVEEAGVRQFLDIGTGLPTADNVHDVAQRADPSCRVVYVDNDPAVLAHARALLTGTPEGTTAYIDADARHTAKIVHEAGRSGLDFDEPVAVLFVAVLHFIADAREVVSRLQDALVPGGHLVLTHAVDQPDFAGVAAAYRESMNLGTPRTRDQILELFDGFDLLPPGLAALPDWRPDEPGCDRSAAGLVLGGVGRRTGGRA